MDTARSQYNLNVLKRGRQDSDSHGGEVMMDTEAGVMGEGMQLGTLAVLEAEKARKQILP